jgi:hypothetical protein
MNPLNRVAGWAHDPPPETSVGSAAAPRPYGEFDVQAFIKRHGLKVRRQGEWRGGEKWELEVCPINPDHKGGCAVITRGRNGVLGFKCHHNTCAGIGWTELRERLEPGYQKSERRSDGGDTSRTEGWPPLVPFTTVPVERIPIDLPPGPVGDMARCVAAATETPIEMAVMTGLGIVAASVAGKVQICPSPGYFEPSQVYVATVLSSGNRKTAVINEMAAPFRTVEEQLIAEITPERNRLASMRKTEEAAIEKLRKQAADKSGALIQGLIEDIVRRETKLPKVPIIPRLWTQDVTPEKLGPLMVENGERMAVISDEGGIFDILAGRYSKTASPNLDLFLQGHSGSPVRVDRGSRETVVLNVPALTLVLTPQPDVLRSLSEHKAFRGRGLLARFLFVIPPSSVGSRTHQTVPVPVHVRNAYDRCIRALLAFKNASEGQRFTLQFSRPAAEHLEEFRHAVEKQMAESGRLHDLQDWGSKLPGAVARLAGGIHCSLYAGPSVPEAIEREVMEVSVRLGELLICHALAGFRIMQKPEKIEHAEKLVVWIRRNGYSIFNVREMFRAHQSRFGEVAAMMPALQLLEDHGYIRQAEREKKTGRPQDVYEVNPAVLGADQE